MRQGRGLWRSRGEGRVWNVECSSQREISYRVGATDLNAQDLGKRLPAASSGGPEAMGLSGSLSFLF